MSRYPSVWPGRVVLLVLALVVVGNLLVNVWRPE